MDMDDDDFMGSLEFDLTAEQRTTVSCAITLASRNSNEFQMVNPLIAIMQWWEANVPAIEKVRASPEETLTEACRLFILAHADLQ
jgi:hypothetical protein